MLFLWVCRTVDHLLFQCPIARAVWSIVAVCLDQQDRSSSYEQFWPWIKKALPRGDKTFIFGFAPIC
jgi:predicted deacetylase